MDKNFEIRYYQQKIFRVLDKMEEQAQGDFSTIIEVPTGGGKTYIGLEYIKQVWGKDPSTKVLWLCNRLPLLSQTAEEANNFFSAISANNGIITISGSRTKTANSANLCHHSPSDIKNQNMVLASYQSLLDDSEIKPSFANWVSSGKLLVIIDEAHHAGSKSYDNLLSAILANRGKPFTLIGLTATPYRGDTLELNLFKWFKYGYYEKCPLEDKEVAPNGYLDSFEEITKVEGDFGKPVINDSLLKKCNVIKLVDVNNLIQMGYLIEPKFYRVPHADKPQKLDMSWVADNLKQDLEQLGKTIVYVDSEEQADSLLSHLCQPLPSFADIAAKYTSQVEENKRDTILKLFRDMDSNLSILVVVDMISEGWDFPNLQTVVMACGVNSIIRLKQRVGRVVRKAPKPTDANTQTSANKEKRVIWFDFNDKTDTPKTKMGYLSCQPQTEEDLSKYTDKSYYSQLEYMPAPSYKRELGYLEEYSDGYRDVSANTLFRTIINVLDAFADDNESLLSVRGILNLSNKTLYVDSHLEKGLHQLYLRVNTDVAYLRNKENDSNFLPVDFEDYLTKLGVSKSSWMYEVKESCFFMSDPRRSVKFHISDEDIITYVSDILDNQLYEPRVQSKEIELLEIINSNKGITLEELKEYKVAQDVDEDVLQRLIDSLWGRDNTSHPHTSTSKTNKPSKPRRKEFYQARYQGLPYPIIKNFSDLVSQGYHWREERADISYTSKVEVKDTKNQKYTSNSEMMDLCHMMQSSLVNIHHIGVLACPLENEAENDVDEFRDIILSSISNTTEDTVKDIVCDLIVSQNKYLQWIEASKIDSSVKEPEDILLALIDSLSKIPAYIHYLVYDRVYEYIWDKLDFYAEEDGIIYKTVECVNKDSLRDNTFNVIGVLKLLPREIADAVWETAFNDAVFDYRPYVKVLRYYPGIKADILTRELNILLRQVDCNKYISGCGGSGADVMNLSFTGSRRYNEYTYPLSVFYKTLSKKETFKDFLEKMKEVIDFIENGTDSSLITDFFNDSVSDGLKDMLKDYGVSTSVTYKTVELVGSEYRKACIERIKKAKKSVESSKFGNTYLKDLAKKYDKTIEEIKGIENRLAGYHLMLEKVYYWCTNVKEDKDIKSVHDDMSLAIMVFMFLSFPERYLFDGCFYENYFSFAMGYESMLYTGHHIVEKWDIQVETNRDVKQVLVTEEHPETTVAYCDIPYAGTDDKMYGKNNSEDTTTSKGFDFLEFKESIESFANKDGKFIISSRHNIVVDEFLQSAYYDVVKKEELTADYTSEIIDKYSAYGDYAGAFWRRVNSIVDFYKSYRGIAKYIVIPYTKSIDSDYRDVISKLREVGNHERKHLFNSTVSSGMDYVLGSLTEEEVKRMLVRTAYSRVPVEIMLTNIDFSKPTDERNLMLGYSLGEKVSILPAVKCTDGSSNSYHAEPVYLVIDYDWYLDILNYKREVIEEQEDTKAIAAALNDYYKNK